MGQPKCGVYGHKGLNTPAHDHNCVIFKKYNYRSRHVWFKNPSKLCDGHTQDLEKIDYWKIST